jgi:hypothetical protein
MENGGTEYSRIAAQFAAAKRDRKFLEEEEGGINHASEFKKKHLLVTAFFLWILYVVH